MMKKLVLKVLVGAALSVIVTSGLVGCGHTMYGVGQDMQNLGKRMKGQHHPNATAPYQAPQYNTPYYGNGANPGGTYPPQSAPNQYGYPR